MWWNFLPGCLRFLPDVHALGDAALHDRGDLGSGLPHRPAARQESAGKGVEHGLIQLLIITCNVMF